MERRDGSVEREKEEKGESVYGNVDMESNMCLSLSFINQSVCSFASFSIFIIVYIKLPVL